MAPSGIAVRHERTVPAAIVPVTVLALTALVYVGTWQFQFVYDDEIQIVHNQLVQHWRYVPYYFSLHVWSFLYPNVPGNYYRPVYLLWLRINHSLFGLNPAGWHLSTIALHVLSTWLVLRLARRITHNEIAAATAALIFGLHPVHIEAVAWVSGGTEPLAAVFVLSSLLSFLNFREDNARRRWWLIASLGLFALALLSKETAVVVPALVFAYAFLNPSENKATSRRIAACTLSSLPFVLITGAYLIARYKVLGALSYTVYPVSAKTTLLTIPSVLWFYLRSLVLPTGRSLFYDLPYVSQPGVRTVLLPLAGVIAAALALLIWWRRTRSNTIPFACALVLMPLLPLMNFSGLLKGELVHDRYLYLPSIGFALLMGLAISQLRLRGDRAVFSKAGLAATAILALLCAAATVWQSVYWANNLVLYHRASLIAPKNETATNNLANELLARGRYDDAIKLYKLALSQDPNYWLPNYNLGYTSLQQGEYAAAEAYFLRAAELNPAEPDSLYYLGQTELHLGRPDRAESLLRRAIQTDPRRLGYRYTLGLALKAQGLPGQALESFRAELAKDPANQEVRNAIEELSR